MYEEAVRFPFSSRQNQSLSKATHRAVVPVALDSKEYKKDSSGSSGPINSVALHGFEDGGSGAGVVFGKVSVVDLFVLDISEEDCNSFVG